MEIEPESNTIYMSTPKINYLGINIAKCVQDLHEEICKTPMSEIKELDK